MRTFIATRRWSAAILAGALSAGLATAVQAQAPRSTLRLVSETPQAAPAPQMSEQELRDTAIDAYVYAYPMVLMELARRQATAVQSPLDGKAPMNQFGHKASYPDPRAGDTPWPSADALYSSLWFDVSRAPLVVNLPATGERYSVLSALDMWSDVFASRGSRTNGRGAQSFVIVGPDWQGATPAGMDVIRSPTATGWLIGWTQTAGPQDYAAVNQIQAGMTANPLAVPMTRTTRARGDGSVYPQTGPGVGAAPIGSGLRAPMPALPAGTPAEQAASMDAAAFFGLFFDLLRNNPPHANDTPILDRMRRIGLDSRRPFSYGSLSPAVQQALADQNVMAATSFFETPTDRVQLRVTGQFQSVDDIRRFPSESHIHFLECSGNPGFEAIKGKTASDLVGREAYIRRAVARLGAAADDVQPQIQLGRGGQGTFVHGSVPQLARLPVLDHQGHVQVLAVQLQALG